MQKNKKFLLIAILIIVLFSASLYGLNKYKKARLKKQDYVTNKKLSKDFMFLSAETDEGKYSFVTAINYHLNKKYVIDIELYENGKKLDKSSIYPVGNGTFYYKIIYNQNAQEMLFLAYSIGNNMQHFHGKLPYKIDKTNRGFGFDHTKINGKKILKTDKRYYLYSVYFDVKKNNKNIINEIKFYIQEEKDRK